MSRLASLLFFLLCAHSLVWSQGASVELISDDASATVLRIQVSDFQKHAVQTPQGEAFSISLEGGTPLLEAGHPDLPKWTGSIAIEDLVHTEVGIVSVAYTDYPGWEVAPSKGNLYRDTDPATVPYTYGAVYDQDQFFPEEIVSLRDPFIFRDLRGQTLVAHPIRYNPVTKTLRVYDEIVVKVKKTEGPSVNPLIREEGKAVRINEPFNQLYRGLFLNYAPQQQRYNQISELGNMLIISHGEYLPVLEPFVEWKRQKGIPTQVVDIATIGNNAADIYEFLSNYYHVNELTYVLLVGDETTVATAQTSANNACDHCYSYQDGDDHFNEFFIGRFNAENAAQVQTMVDRTLEYEKAPYLDNPEWFRTAIGSGSSQGPGDDGEYDYEHINNLKIDMLAYTYGAIWEFYDGDQSTASPTPGDVTADGIGNPVNTAIGDVINGGTSFYNYCGHGSHASLASGNFNVTTVHNHLENVGMYPFMVAVACCVGDFQNDFGSGECLGEAWIRATDALSGSPTGGIGGLFSSILQSWSPPMEGQDEMNKLLVETGPYSTRHSIGGIAIHGFASMIEAYGGGGEEMADTWNIFGDPSVVLWTDTPADMVVDHVPAVNVGTSQLQVLCDVDDALVGLYYQGDLIGNGLVVDGSVTIEFEPVLEPEQILVTVTAFNHLPYQGPVEVIVAQGPYVILEQYQLDDAAGNNDQEADFGESILMNVTLENVGPVVAPGVVATLSTLAPEVTITQNEALYGDILENSQAGLDGAFAFDVAEVLTDQQTVFFELKLESDGTEWTYSLPVKLSAPVLKAQPTYVLDDGPAGNGRLDQGELVQLTLTALNTGHSDAPNSTGTLSTSSPYVTILNPVADLSTLLQEGGESVAVFDLQIAEEVPMFEPVAFTFTVESGAYGDSEIYDLAINLIVEDFENGFTEAFNWSSNSPSPWFSTEVNPYQGAACMQSGLIDNSSQTELSMNVEVLEAGMISFARRVSSEQDWDFLRFYINGVQVAEWSGEQPWEEVTEYVIQGGPTEFKWVYSKDEYLSAGEDAAWIDEIILPLIQLPEDTTTHVSDLLLTAEGLTVFPNPAHTTAQVQFRLSEASRVSLALYNAHGQQVLTILDGDLPSGTFAKGFSVASLPSGVYWLSLRAGNVIWTKKLIR